LEAFHQQQQYQKQQQGDRCQDDYPSDCLNFGYERFDAVVVNFAINPKKGEELSRKLLKPNGRLLAPVNNIPDYWFEQNFLLYDCKGRVLSKNVDFLFQPDVTDGSCQGIWCARKLIDRY